MWHLLKYAHLSDLQKQQPVLNKKRKENLGQWHALQVSSNMHYLDQDI